MHILSLDLETRSPVDLSKASVYRYAESPDFDILLFGVSVDEGPVRVFDLASGERLPEEILSALMDPAVEKWAYNCAFERVCLSFWLRRFFPSLLPETGEDPPFLSPEGWRCSMILAACFGLPFGLEKVGEILGLEDRKLKEGKELVRFFCKPLGKDDAGAPVWPSPEAGPEKWKCFKRYNARDVEVEMEIRRRLRSLPVPEELWEEYALDQRINDRGIRVDLALVRQAIRLDELTRAGLMSRFRSLTGLENPNSVVQLKRFLASRGLAVGSLGKQDVQDLMEFVPEDLREVLSLRSQLAKSSVRKYHAMEAGANRDGRCRGLFQFYGAARTGRWAGRLIQLQNLPQNHMEDLEEARALVRNGDAEQLSLRYPSVPEVLSELIRTAFVPRDGEKFIVADFSAVEARALSCWRKSSGAWRSIMTAGTFTANPPPACFTALWKRTVRTVTSVPGARWRSWPWAMAAASAPCGRWAPCGWVSRRRSCPCWWTAGAGRIRTSSVSGGMWMPRPEPPSGMPRRGTSAASVLKSIGESSLPASPPAAAWPTRNPGWNRTSTAGRASPSWAWTRRSAGPARRHTARSLWKT